MALSSLLRCAKVDVATHCQWSSSLLVRPRQKPNHQVRWSLCTKRVYSHSQLIATNTLNLYMAFTHPFFLSLSLPHMYISTIPFFFNHNFHHHHSPSSPPSLPFTPPPITPFFSFSPPPLLTNMQNSPARPQLPDNSGWPTKQCLRFWTVSLVEPVVVANFKWASSNQFVFAT